MTTEEIRKVIIVRNWVLTPHGLSIDYDRTDEKGLSSSLFLSPEKTLKELSIVGSVEDYILEGNNKEWPSKAFMNDEWYSFPQFIGIYRMCQWEALSIVIRHEEEKELANDMNMLELDAALNALKQD